MDEHMVRWKLNNQWNMCINAYTDGSPTRTLKDADDIINKRAIPAKNECGWTTMETGIKSVLKRNVYVHGRNAGHQKCALTNNINNAWL